MLNDAFMTHTKILAVNLRLNRGFTLLHTKNLAVSLRLNRGLTLLQTKYLAFNVWLNFWFVISVNIF